jgi:hypothetical protein
MESTGKGITYYIQLALDDVIERYGTFIKACGSTSDGVRVLKGEIAPPAGWEDFVADSQARRESER